MPVLISKYTLFSFFTDAQVTITPNADKVINEGDTQGFTYKCQNGDISGSSTYPLWKDKDDNVIGGRRVHTNAKI